MQYISPTSTKFSPDFIIKTLIIIANKNLLPCNVIIKMLQISDVLLITQCITSVCSMHLYTPVTSTQ